MRGLYTNQKRAIEHFARMLCSCFFSYSYSYSVRRGGRYSYSMRFSLSILPIGPQVTANLFDQRAVSPQFQLPSSTSTVSLSTASLSTSTTKSQARHEPKHILAQPFAYGPNSRLGSIRNPDLAQDMLDVLFDRFVTDRQIIGDLSIGHPTG